MRFKNHSVGKTSEPSRYLEVHIQENGTVVFSNLSPKEVILVDKISGKKHQPRDFLCG
jgi:hypothetical protein